MVYFKDIRPGRHYLDEHSRDIPWHEVVKIIFMTKNPRKKGDRFEIETPRYYVLFDIKNEILTVINAKKTK